VSPNPGGDAVTLLLQVPAGPTGATVQVLDLSGRTIRVLRVPAGEAVCMWDGQSFAGTRPPAGICFLQAELDGVRLTGRAARVQ
jgi:hypothetical protein